MRDISFTVNTKDKKGIWFTYSSPKKPDDISKYNETFVNSGDLTRSKPLAGNSIQCYIYFLKLIETAHT